jgi:glycosyltransferase involved in cell wall biosynthesis
MKKVAVIVPCHNEEKGIVKVIEEIPHAQLKKHGLVVEVIVIDNNSIDKTAEVAKKAGAMVIHESKKGKGNAMRTGFANLPADVDYVVMLDGDNTYRPKEMPRMLEPLTSGFCDAVVGSRLSGRLNEGALSFQNRVVNWAFAFLVRVFYRANVTDVLSGYFAWTRETIDDLRQHIVSEGFAIEMEMITKMEKLKHEVYSVPISYDHREGETKINRIADGIKILHMFARVLFWRPEPVAVAEEEAV